MGTTKGVRELIYEDKYFNEYLRNGIIIDSCILLEFFKLVYQKNNGITITKEETILLDRLERIFSLGTQKYITSHVLAELSNLINTKVCKAGSTSFCKCILLMKQELNKEEYKEIHLDKEKILNTEEIIKFGVTDAGIILLSKEDKKISICLAL